MNCNKFILGGTALIPPGTDNKNSIGVRVSNSKYITLSSYLSEDFVGYIETPPTFSKDCVVLKDSEDDAGYVAKEYTKFSLWVPSAQAEQHDWHLSREGKITWDYSNSD